MRGKNTYKTGPHESSAGAQVAAVTISADAWEKITSTIGQLGNDERERLVYVCTQLREDAEQQRASAADIQKTLQDLAALIPLSEDAQQTARQALAAMRGCIAAIHECLGPLNYRPAIFGPSPLPPLGPHVVLPIGVHTSAPVPVHINNEKTPEAPPPLIAPTTLERKDITAIRTCFGYHPGKPPALVEIRGKLGELGKLQRQVSLALDGTLIRLAGDTAHEDFRALTRPLASGLANIATTLHLAADILSGAENALASDLRAQAVAARQLAESVELRPALDECDTLTRGMVEGALYRMRAKPTPANIAIAASAALSTLAVPPGGRPVLAWKHDAADYALALIRRKGKSDVAYRRGADAHTTAVDLQAKMPGVFLLRALLAVVDHSVPLEPTEERPSSGIENIIRLFEAAKARALSPTAEAALGQ